MASNDVRDVLNLPSEGLAPRPSKKQKIAAPRPNLKGLAREVQSLGGDTPIAIVPEVSLYKKRRQINRKPASKWELRAFRNSARDDNSLVLRHWKRKSEAGPRPDRADGSTAVEGETVEGGGEGATEGGEQGDKQKEGEPEVEDSAFARFNVKVQVPDYNEEQYDAKLQSDDWTKDETDYLFQLVRDFDLRWPLIWDRFEYSPKQPDDMDLDGSSTAVVPAPRQRTMEDLKARYYEVAAKMMEVQKPKQYMTQFEWDMHTMMLNFDPDKEAQRKRFALNTMSRTEAEAKEEESLLIEVKRIMARAERFNEERRELYQRLDHPHADQDISAFRGSAGLSQLLNTLQTQSQARKRKPLTAPETASPATGAASANAQPSSAVSETAPSRRESIAAQSAGHRDSIGAEKPTPVGNKKGQPPPERRKLSEYEEQIYGVSTHERLSSGPTFRYERVNKLFSHKSGQQQARIQHVLNELSIPVRLNMPTATVVAEYEKLVLAVTSLVDLRKQKDKLENEIKIEEAKRAERAKARAALGLDGQADEQPSADDKKKKKKDGEASTSSENAAATATTAEGDKSAETNGDSNAKGSDSQPAAAAAAEAPATEAAAKAAKAEEAPTKNSDGDASAAAAAAEGEDQPTPLVKQEEGATRPGSSGGPRNKRSASVLSATSDKSTKRQKK